ncbi:Boophilin-H2 like protein [Argiope bruennichi]|uniref:Boophilin-H2 like protein n=1 Tax=Argiope bruennichi TaxID=94029 RepID=A0A8T0E1U5_ARGBR|nr:Boophilin-H2 like protein [Argiope bruennichi]
MKVLVFLCFIAGTFAFPAEQADCSARPDPGLCDAYMPRYYYNEVEGRCKQFIYGGCGGNSNNFRSEEECNRACTDKQDTQVVQKAYETCSQDKDVGTCKMSFESCLHPALVMELKRGKP